MIKVKLTKNNNYYKRIIITGHANYDDFGKDIVCAAVSSTVITSVNSCLAIDNESISYEDKNGLDIKVLKDVSSCCNKINQTDIISRTSIDNIELGSGNVRVTIDLKEELFYQILSEITGVTVENEGDLFGIISELSSAKKKYDKIAYALEEVNAKGYGIVTPSIDDLVLEEPEMVKQGSRFGVKLKATAPSIHMIKTNVTTEVSPIVGSEKQSEELVNYLLSGFENDPKQIWESNIFGKSLHELVNEGLQTKLSKMPEEAQLKLQETLERIVNEGSGGLICIIL